MKVEIWSDVMCPFCYIGKRKLEHALEQFKHADDIDIEWKSYQLNPGMETNPEISINEYLARTKGWSLEQARQANQRVTDMAAEVGLNYHMDEAVVANSFKAHTFIQFAKTKNLGGEAEETLFHAYFTQSQNIDDTETLIDIAEQIGLDADETYKALASDTYATAVKEDIQQAGEIKVRGVPFFVFDQKYALSGAQEPEAFLQALNKSWEEWNEQQPPVELSEQNNNACSVDGDC